MYVNMVLAHYTFQNMNILTVAYLNQLFTAAFLDITLQHFIAVLRRPHQVTCQTAYRIHYDDSLPCHKDNNLYRNLSRRNKLRGSYPILG